MNDVQIRLIEQRLKRYDAMVSGKARFYPKEGKLFADVSADEPILGIDIDEEREWTKDALKQLEEHHFRQIEFFNSFCIASKQNKQLDEAGNQEQIELLRSELHRISDLIGRLKG